MTGPGVASRDDDPYWPVILGEAPRTLGFLDREALSPTAGCGDRTYWAWKFTDFPGARFQESLCVLSYLHATPRADNPYAGSAALREWLDLGFRFWVRIQHADGSHDEAYPWERSLAATAFTAFYVSEALEFLGSSLAPATRALVADALGRSAGWLCRNDERHGVLSNHLAAAAAALQHVHRLTGSEEYARRAGHFLDRILSRQSREGWYEEYGGADPGYQTHGTFYLARTWELTRAPALLESMKSSTAFLEQCIHPDGSIGGEYASRNTQTYYPAAFEMLAGVDPSAARIARRMRDSVRSGAAVGQRSVDAWNFFPLLNNLVFARRALEAARAAAPAESVAPERRGLQWFPEAGIARVDEARRTIVVGTSKGGVVKAFAAPSGPLVESDCGLIGQLDDGRTCSTQYLDRARAVEVSAGRIVVRGTLMEGSRPVMSPLRFLLFRGFMLTVGRVPRAAAWVKDVLVRVLITRRSALRLEHVRTITIDGGALTIEDRVSGPDLARLRSLSRGRNFTTVHMGSSRYFVPQELVAPGDGGSLEAIPLVAGATEVTSRRTVPLPA